MDTKSTWNHYQTLIKKRKREKIKRGVRPKIITNVIRWHSIKTKIWRDKIIIFLKVKDWKRNWVDDIAIKTKREREIRK